MHEFLRKAEFMHFHFEPPLVKNKWAEIPQKFRVLFYLKYKYLKIEYLFMYEIYYIQIEQPVDFLSH